MQPGDRRTENDPLFAHQNQGLLVDKLARVKREHAGLNASPDALSRVGMRMHGLAVLARLRYGRHDLLSAEVFGFGAGKARPRDAACRDLDPVDATLDLRAYGAAHLIGAVDHHA